MEMLVTQQHVLECFETVLTKGDEARFRLYEVRPTSHIALIDGVSLLISFIAITLSCAFSTEHAENRKEHRTV